MRLPRVQFTVRRLMVELASLFVVCAVAELAPNHRRVVRFRAAWAYDEQYRACTRLAKADAREAARERQGAAQWPEDSSQRNSHLQAAAFHASMEAGVARVSEAARTMASELRLLARTPR